MLATYGKDAVACDEMYDCEFWGYSQNLDFIMQRQSDAMIAAMLPLLKMAFR